MLESKKLLTNHKGRYIFKPGGLIKKTISIRIDGHPHHLVCYYNKRDFCSSHLQNSTRAGQCSSFNHDLMRAIREIKISEGMLAQQTFRKPVNATMMEGQQVDQAHPPCHDDAPVIKKPTPKRRSSFPGAAPSVRPRREHYAPYSFVPIAPAIESSSSFGESVFPMAIHASDNVIAAMNDPGGTPAGNIQFIYGQYPGETPPTSSIRSSDTVLAAMPRGSPQYSRSYEGEGLEPDLGIGTDPRNGLKWASWFTSPDAAGGYDINGNGLVSGSPVLPPPDPMLTSLRPPSTVFDKAESPDCEF